jgi:hypothetical protein
MINFRRSRPNKYEPQRIVDASFLIELAYIRVWDI